MVAAAARLLWHRFEAEDAAAAAAAIEAASDGEDELGPVGRGVVVEI